MMTRKKGSVNIHLYSLIYLVMGIGWGLYFRSLFASKTKRIVAALTVWVTFTYYLITNIILPPPITFDSLGYVITTTGLLLLIFLFYHELMNNIKEDPLSLNFDFWISSGLLIYCLGAFGIFLTYSHFTNQILPIQYFTFENREILTYLWGVHNVLLFLAGLLTLVGVLWIVYRRKSTSS